MTKKIAIIGGGYVGFEVAQELDAIADVTLIEQREAFVHAPAAIRALVQPDLLDQIILPYGKLLSNGRVLRDRATEVSERGVTLESGTNVEADFIVIATGSSYAAPFKPAGSSAAEFRKTSIDISLQLAKANSVVIVGAGAVGTELAGEIATAQPGKKITLISSDATLFPAYPKALGERLQRKLEKLGVRVTMGQRATNLPRTDVPFCGAVELTDGRVIEADIIFPVIGSKPDTTLLRDLPNAEIGASGRIKTDKWLRPSSFPNVFAAGDIVDVGDGMTIVATSRQNPWLVKTLMGAIGGKPVEDQKPYKPWKMAPILIPLGPKIGNSWLFHTVGNWVTRAIKGKSIFIPKYHKAFGVKGR